MMPRANFPAEIARARAPAVLRGWRRVACCLNSGRRCMSSSLGVQSCLEGVRTPSRQCPRLKTTLAQPGVRAPSSSWTRQVVERRPHRRSRACRTSPATARCAASRTPPPAPPARRRPPAAPPSTEPRPAHRNSINVCSPEWGTTCAHVHAQTRAGNVFEHDTAYKPPLLQNSAVTTSLSKAS